MYTVMAVPTLLYGSQTGVPTQRDLNKIHYIEMRFYRIVKGSTVLDIIKNEDIRN